MEEGIIERPEEKIERVQRKQMLIKLCLALSGVLVLMAGKYFDLLWQEKTDIL